MTIGLSIGGQLLNLSYADHVTALRNSRNDLKPSTDILTKHAAKIDPFVSVSKTECMTTDKVNPKLRIYDKLINKCMIIFIVHTNFYIFVMSKWWIKFQDKIGFGVGCFYE